MRCEICGKYAPVHVTEIRGGELVQGHYCGLHAPATPADTSLGSSGSITQKLKAFLQEQHLPVPLRCENCSKPAVSMVTEVGPSGEVGHHRYCEVHAFSIAAPVCRTTVVRVVDAATSRPLPIGVQDCVVISEPVCVWRLTRHTIDSVEITWNICAPFTVTSAGYEKKAVELTAASPQLIIVPLRLRE